MKFSSSFPEHLQSVHVNGALDPHLYAANLAPLVALILLHDPQAHIEQSACSSTQRLLYASRTILKFIYDVQSSSFDARRLDCFCFLAWFMAGRSLTRFWQVAQQVDAQDQMNVFRTEVEYIASSLQTAGQRVTLASRYSVMLSDGFERLAGHSLHQESATLL